MFADYSAGEIFALSKAKLDECLIVLGKHFRKQYNKKAEAEIILIGGASVLINYDFRNASTDADALIQADASMKESINHVRDKFGLPHDRYESNERPQIQIRHVRYCRHFVGTFQEQRAYHQARG